MAGRRKSRTLVPIALGLASLVLAWPSAGKPDRHPASVAAAPTVDAVAPDLEVIAALPPESQFFVPPLDTYRATFERPLFSQTRRPSVPNQVAERPAERLPFDLTLHGIVYSSGNQLVVVSSEGEPDMLRLGLGAGYRGWTITDISPRSVTFTRDNTVRKLELEFHRQALGQRTPRTPAQ